MTVTDQEIPKGGQVMWKKTLPAMVLVGALVVPAGAALAATDDDTPVQVATMETSRQRIHVPDGCGDCDQSRDQTMLRLNDSALCDGSGQRNGPGLGEGALDGTGPLGAGPAYGNRFGAGGR
jgi:hypothetical protein